MQGTAVLPLPLYNQVYSASLYKPSSAVETALLPFCCAGENGFKISLSILNKIKLTSANQWFKFVMQYF